MVPTRMDRSSQRSRSSQLQINVSWTKPPRNRAGRQSVVRDVKNSVPLSPYISGSDPWRRAAAMPNGKAWMARRAPEGSGGGIDMEARMLKPSTDQDEDGDRPMDLYAPILSLRRSLPVQKKQSSSVSFQQRPWNPFFAWEKRSFSQALALVPSPPATIILQPPPRSISLKQQQRLSPVYQEDETMGEGSSEALDPPPSLLETCIVSVGEDEELSSEVESRQQENDETTATRELILMRRFLAAARAVAAAAAEPRPGPPPLPSPSPCWKRSNVSTPARTFSDLIRRQEREEEEQAEAIAERSAGFFAQLLGFGCCRRPDRRVVATRTWKKIEPQCALEIQCRDLAEKAEEGGEEDDYEEELRWRRPSRFTPSRGPMIEQKSMGFLGIPASRSESDLLGSKSKQEQQQMIRIQEDDDESESLEPLQLVVDEKRLTISSSSFTFWSSSSAAEVEVIEQRGSSASSSSSDLREMALYLD